MSDADVIQWRRRRTARWMSLSLAARGCVEGIVASLDERGELQLPNDGLRGLAPLLGRSWTEVGPAIDEVLASGKLRFDRERLVIIDPSHEPKPLSDRQETDSLRMQVAVARAELVAVNSARELSQTEDAIRARAARAARKAAKLAAQRSMEERQIGLFDDRRSIPVATTVATAVDHAAPPESGVISTRSTLVATTVATTVDHVPSLSDLKIFKKERREGRPRLELDPDTMPNGWLEQSLKLRPDLPEPHVRRSWRKFTLAKTGKYYGWPEAQGRWEAWLENERVKATLDIAHHFKPPNKPAQTDVAIPPYYARAKHALPDVEPPAGPTPKLVQRITPIGPDVRRAMATFANAIGATS